MFSLRSLKWAACLVPLMCVPALGQSALDTALSKSTDVLLNGMSNEHVMPGYAKDASGVFRAVKYDQGVAVTLGQLVGEIESKSLGMTTNGFFSVGYSQTSSQQKAVVWDRYGNISEIAYTSVSHDEASAYGVAYDSNGDMVAVGYSGTSTNKQGFYYTMAGGVTQLSTINASFNTEALTISVDGTTIVGYSSTSASVEQAVIWTGASYGTRTQLADAGFGSQRAMAISGNGTYIVGRGGSSSSVSTEALIWDMSGGGSGSVTAISFGVTTSEAEALSVSNDGRVVGYYTNQSTSISKAFVYVSGAVTDLGTLDGGTESMATSISADGETIMGVSNTSDPNVFRPFVFRSQMQDVMNVMASVEAIADGTSKGVDRNNRLARRLREEDCEIQEGAESCVGIRGLASSLFEGTNAFGGNIMGAHQFNDEFRAGLAVGLYGESSINEAINPNYGIGVGGYINYRLGQLNYGKFASELNVRLDGAWFYTDADIKRGAGLNDVQVMRNDTAFNSGAVGLRFEADNLLSSQVLLKPYVGAYWQITTRDGYSEDESGDTTANFDGLTANAVAAVAGLNADIALTEVLLLRIGAGAEVDFYADGIIVSGTSDIPGMGTFSFNGADNQNWVRGNLLAGLAYDMGNLGLISLNGQLFTPRYETKLGGDVSVQYSLSF